MAKYKIIPSSRTIVQSPISIGHKAEKGVEAIEFDVTAWVETYGSGTLTVIMRRWGDAIPYPIALEIDESNKATWTLSDIDTAKAGMAYAQLSYIVGETVVKKSDIYTFRVMDSLTGEGDPPEAYESWLENLTHLAAEAMAEVLDIEGIVTDKTLTVDGGIADAKATGDALALKADKSTTYTKTEVNQMIEDVEVETDTTLTIAGAAADAAETGRQIGLIKADLGDVDELLNLSHTLSASVSESFTEWVRKTIFAGVTLKAGKTYRVTVTFSSINTVQGYVAISKLDNTSPDYYSPSLKDKTTATFTYTPSTDISANITVRFSTTGTYAFDCTFIEVKENVIDTIQDDISEIRTNLSTLGEDCESFVSYHTELGTNLYNAAWYVDGEYIKTNEIGENASYQRSTIVSLPQGNYLINCRKATYGGNALIVRYYDESNSYLRQKNATLLLDSGNDSVMLVTVESGESGIMFNIRKSLNTMILRGDSIEEWSDTYIPFNPDKKIIDSEFYVKGNVEENPLYKKSLAVDGDSISYGAQYTGGYAKVISDNNSMTCQNLSVSGGTITAETYTSGGAERHWICRTMQTLSADADFYIIEGGVNDSSLQVTLGTITNGYTDTLDDTTFYGALETIFKTLTTKYVGKKYMFVIPHRASPGLCPGGDYYTAVINCASKWGIKVLDLTQSVPPFNNFRGDDTYDAIRNAYTKEGDGWHPTELCYKKYYAPQIEAVLKSL